MKATIVVADKAHARIFTAADDKAPLKEIETLVHPESRLHERDLTSGLSGRSGGNSYTGKTDHAHHEMEVFAIEIAQYLDDRRNKNEMDNLLLVAAPAVLGELRQHLTSATAKMVNFELNKNLAQHTPEDIRAHLPHFFVK